MPHTLRKQALEQAQLIFEDGLRCLQENNFDKADGLFVKAYGLDPNNIDVLNLLGIREYQKQNYQEAIRFLSKAHQLGGNSAQTLNNLGLAHNATSEFAKALEFFDLAIAIDKGLAEAHNNRGNALKGLDKNDLALEAYKSALQLRPEYAEAISNQGIIFLEQKHYQEAIACLEKAVQLNPNLASAFNSLGNAFTELHEYQLAFQAFEHALQIEPHYLDACLNFGISLKKAKQHADSIKCFEHAISLNPSHAKTYFLLGEVFFDIGNSASASENFRKSLELNPKDIESQFALTIAQIPKVANCVDELHDSRRNFSKELKHLKHINCIIENPDDIISNIGRHAFYLAYQDENNLSLLSEYGDICTKYAKPIQDSLSQVKRQSERSGQKIRIGIAGHYFCDHPVWYAITKGWLTQLNKDLFEIHVFNTNGVEDQETKLAKQHASSYLNSQDSAINLAQLILDKQLDILIYPEISMDPTTKALACLRLAPIQAVSWGHPETTGLSTIDYFLSGESYELAESQNYYREKLIKLPGLGTYFESAPISAVELDLAKFGIDSSHPILLCPGSPSKYSPVNDAIFIEIAKRLGNCQFIFFSFQKELTEILRSRLYKAFNDANLKPEQFIKFIPFLEKGAFHNLMKKSDLYLDTIGFSGFNTAMQSISCNLPIIAKEGQFMRGKLASGILREFKLDALVAKTNKEYIDIVVSLIANKALLRMHREEIALVKPNAFNNRESIHAFELVLINIFKKMFGGN